MPFCYFAIGTTLANMANVETAMEFPPQVRDELRIPLLAPVRRRTLDNAVQRNGSIDVPLRWDILKLSALNTFITSYWANYTTSSAALFASWMDETGNYSPFSVTLERPLQGEHYRIQDPVWLQELRIPGYGWTLQSVTKSSDVTTTTSERLVYVDTSGGTRTMTLPALAGVTSDTVYSFVKTSASNTLTLDGNSSETVDGNATKSVTALNARINIVKTSATTWVSI